MLQKDVGVSMSNGSKNERDLHVHYVPFPLQVAASNISSLDAAAASANPSGLVTIGQGALECEVRRHVDLRNLHEEETFVVTCTSYVSISNDSLITAFNRWSYKTPSPGQPSLYGGWNLGASLIQLKILPLSTDSNIARLTLLDYAPKTLNAAVNMTLLRDSGADRSHTDGSSQTDSHDYEMSLTPLSTAPDGAGDDAAISEWVALKDWAAYASVNPAGSSVTWIWAQESPWNIIDYIEARTGLLGGREVMPLPKSVEDSLFYALPDKQYLLAPTPLSGLGLKMVSWARWLYRPVLSVHPRMSVSINLDPFLWQLVKGAPIEAFSASVTSLPVESVPASTDFGLVDLALDPITSSGASNGAIVGFFRSQFSVAPGAEQFRIVSGANNLCVTGKGFDPITNYDSPTTASAITTAAPATLTIFFKVLDDSDDLTLHIKHWKTTDVNCVLTIVVNPESDSGLENVKPIPERAVRLTRHVDWADDSSGSDNVTSIVLRNKDYTSAEFYDYLRLGLNTITVIVAPLAPSQSCGYALRAMAVS